MRERPILFSTPMVRALLAGRKTQTRRLVKPQPRQGVNGCMYDDDWSWPRGGISYTVSNRPSGPSDITDDCPYGVPGDRLWSRETWSDTLCDNIALYKADGSREPVAGQKWRSPIHMPRWASRILLEVTGVRVERVDAITEADAIAEGFAESFDSAGACHERTTARENFLHTFYDLNERAPRGSNPWVWVVEFKVVTPEVAR